jgi:hypothetical protein
MGRHGDAGPGSVPWVSQRQRSRRESTTENPHVHAQAWVKLDGAQLPPAQKVVASPNSLILGIGTAGGSQPLLYPEFWDTAGNRYMFQAGVIPVNEWVLLEAVWIQGQRLTGYINGVQVDSVPVGSASLQSVSSLMTVGASDSTRILLPPAQALALDELHGDEHIALVQHTHLVDRHHVRVGQPSQRLPPMPPWPS